VGWLRHWLLVGLAGASFVASVALAGLHPAADFYSPYTRFWELAAGALLAWVQRPRTVDRPGMANTISLVGLLLLLGSLVLLNSQMEFPGWLAAIPALGALLLLGAGPEAWVNQQIAGAASCCPRRAG
jgi:peptidoglycan/LPS O-acetylase OafA/YrhL